MLRFGRLAVEPSTGELLYDAAPVALRDKERELLLYLARAAGRVVSREELLFEVWGYRKGVASRTVDTTVRRLRAQLELAALKTVRNEGYCLIPQGEAPTLPARPRLEGREAELEAVLGHLLEGRHVALVGPSGMGATAVAIEAAYRLRERGLPVTWGSPAPDEGWLVHDDPDPDGVRRAASRERALVVVRRLVPSFVHVRLGPLEPDAGARLLAWRLTERGLRASPEQLRAVSIANDGVPRALERAAKTFELGAPACAMAVDLVGAEELREAWALSSMAHLGFPLDASLLASASGTSPEQARAALEELSERGLLVHGAGWRLLEPLAAEVRRVVPCEEGLIERAIEALTARIMVLLREERHEALGAWGPALRRLVPCATGRPLFELLRALLETGQRLDTDLELPRWIASLQFQTAHDRAIQGWAHVQALENAEILPAILAHAPAAAAALAAIDKPGLEGWMREAYVAASLSLGRRQEARAELERLRAAWSQVDDGLLVCMYESYALQCAHEPGEPVQLERYRALAERMAALGHPLSAAFPLTVAGSQLQTQGPLESAVQVLEEALVWCEGPSHVWSGVHLQLASLHVALGDGRAARHHLEQGRQALTLGPSFRASYHLAAGALAAVEGRDEEALEAFLVAEQHLRWGGWPEAAWARRLRACVEGHPERVPPAERLVVERIVQRICARRV